MPLVLRSATPLDADAIAAVHVASWRAAYRDTLTVEVLARVTVEERAAQWRDLLDGDSGARGRGTRTFLARGRDDNAIAGFASAGPSRDGDDDRCLEIYALYVLPGRWRQGLGSALFEACLASARREKRREVALWVVATNERARAFSEAHGMAPDGLALVRPTFGVRLPEVRYRAVLAPPGK